MPRDFKSFAEENQNVINENKNKVREYEQLINKYKDMDQNSLMQNLFSEAARLKKEGKLNANTLNNLKQTITPFLNSEQQKMLNELVNAINNQ